MTGTWKQGYRDADLHLLVDASGEVLASCINMGNQWCALDADGNVIGYAKSLGLAKELIR